MNAVLLASDHWHDDGGWFPVLPLLFLVLWVLLFVTVGRRWRHGGRHRGESVLAERYARGEIDEAEYRSRRAVLRERC